MIRAPRLVATDLDGTIVRSDGTISARTVAAFHRLAGVGASYVLVTGRPPRLMAEIARALGRSGTAICSNGAFVYDLHSGTVVQENPIAPDALAEAVRRLRAAIPDIGIAVEHAFEMASDHAYAPDHWDDDVTVQRLPDSELLARPAPKLVARHPSLSADELLAIAAPVLGDIVNPCHSNGTRLVEAVALGTSKAAALADFAARLGVAPVEVVAFGDMPNDMSMLAYAGVSYAVGNAHPDVLAAVRQVIGGNDDDGVAVVLEQLFPATN